MWPNEAAMVGPGPGQQCSPAWTGKGQRLQGQVLAHDGGRVQRKNMKTATGHFNRRWLCYGQMDQHLHVEALRRAAPAQWSALELNGQTISDKTAAMAVAFERFNGSTLETHDPDEWFMLMAHQYITLGCRLEGRTQSQVASEGQALWNQHQATAIAQQHLAQAQMVQMAKHAQAQAQVAQRCAHHFRPISMMIQIPAMPVMHQDPIGRHFVQGLGRSRYLSRESSGGAEDWRLEPDGIINSQSRNLVIHVFDLLGQNLTDAWPGGPSSSSEAAPALAEMPLL